jgi:hypothetical protein
MENNQELRHYRMGGKLSHHGTEVLPGGRDIEIFISHIVWHDELSVGGQNQKGMWEAYFCPNPYTKLPIILNATNRKRLFRLSGTPYLETLKDFPIRLTQEKARDVRDGGETMGIRISMIKPKNPVRTDAKQISKEKDILTIDHPRYARVKESISSGTATIEDVEKVFIVSEEVKKILIGDGK